MSDSVRPHRQQPTGLLCPWDSPGKILEWVAISFSNAWKWKVKVKSLSRVRLFATPWTAAYQAPPSMGVSRQEYWNGVPSPSLATHIGQTVTWANLHRSGKGLIKIEGYMSEGRYWNWFECYLSIHPSIIYLPIYIQDKEISLEELSYMIIIGLYNCGAQLGKFGIWRAYRGWET